MKDSIARMNKVFESRIRLGIMSALMVNDEVDFLELRNLLHVTDGNLASHLGALERADYIAVRKEFVGRKPRTSYAATPSGKREFSQHINALEKFVRQNRK